MENTLEAKKKKFIEQVGAITYNSAHVKFNDDENWPIEYVRCGDACYSNPNRVGEKLIEYSRNVQEALRRGRKLKSIEEHGEHIDPFIIKYHPAWLALKEGFGFIKIDKEEVECSTPYIYEKYGNLFRDNFTALGVKADFGRAKYGAIMSINSFATMFQPRAQEFVLDDEHNHPDFVAFRQVTKIKMDIDDYNRTKDRGLSLREMECEYKSVGYCLDEDGFPRLTIGSGERKRKNTISVNRMKKWLFLKN